MDVQTELGARRPAMRRRLIRVGALAAVAALLPLAALATLASANAQEVVREEVAARLELAASLSVGLVSSQLSTAVTLIEAESRRTSMVAAVADGNPANFDLPEIRQELLALKASRSSLATTGVIDLAGILRQSPDLPDLIGRDVSGRPYFRGLIATGSTYVSEAFVAFATGNPVVVGIATYIRAPSAPGGPPGRPLAVLTVAVQLTEVQAVVGSVGREHGVSLWVTDRQNQLLAAPGGGVDTLRPVSAAPVGPALSARPGQFIDLEAAHPALVVVRQPVDVAGWTVYAAVARTGAYAGVASIRSTVVHIALPLAAVVLVGILALLRTQRRQWLAEAALEVASAEARSASEQKTAFLANMSHELRTPLNAILGFGQLLALDELTTEQHEAVDHVVQAGGHLLDLVDEVLDIARMERGALRLSLEPVSLCRVLDSSLGMLGPLAVSVQVSLDVEGPAEDCHVQADNQRLRQVTMNLLSNAIKYNKPGGRVTVRSHETPEGALRLSITDTGKGIAPADLPRLFRPFERVSADASSPVEGTGLGLALSRHLMSAMGGEIGVDSVLGVGSTFWIELPVADAPVSDAEPPADPRPGRHAGPGTVLYVEDNTSNVRLLEHVMARRPQLNLLVAMQGQLALDMALEHQPDLVLLDLHLPDMSGEMVLRVLRADPRTSALPVVMLTADASYGHPARLLAQGATAFLTKPFDVPKLLDVLDRWGVRSADSPRDPVPAAAPARVDLVTRADGDPAEQRLQGFVHDVINLLGVTASYCSILAMSEQTDETRTALDEIQTVTSAAVALSKGLLQHADGKDSSTRVVGAGVHSRAGR